jgi:hypothetical protein
MIWEGGGAASAMHTAADVWQKRPKTKKKIFNKNHVFPLEY